MIDTHAHLNFDDFNKDLDDVIKRSFEEGLERIIVASSSVESSKKAVEIAEKDERIFAAVGIHPHDIKDLDKFDDIEKLVNHKKVVAIGETGFDYYYLKGDSEDIKEKQRELFKKHIKLAERTRKPIIFHNRDSDNDFYSTIKDFKGRGVLHCYSGDWDYAEKILDLGFYISFTGIITFDKTGKLEDVIEKMPISKIMVETDCPYLAPIPYRGERAEPYHVNIIADRIAEIKGLSLKEIDGKTTTNAKEFFGI